VTDDRADLELAASLVRDAGLLARQMLRDGLDTMHKSSISDVVSAADHAAEDLVVGRLRAARPADGLVGEEGTDVAAGESGRTWYIDPVDGTYNFLSGLQSWCSALALGDSSGQAEGTLLGAIYQPSADELWLGGRNHPTTCNGVPVTPLTDRPLAELSIATYLHPPTMSDDELRLPLLRVIGGAATIRMLGSASVEMGAISAGRLGLWIQHGSFPWDWLPGVAIVTAAGGVAETVTIGAHRWHIAGNRQAVTEAKALLLAG
jgi:fructose-1,6-bisphosphatase/inositol monophosphatase family enzyme